MYKVTLLWCFEKIAGKLTWKKKTLILRFFCCREFVSYFFLKFLRTKSENNFHFFSRFSDFHFFEIFKKYILFFQDFQIFIFFEIFRFSKLSTFFSRFSDFFFFVWENVEAKSSMFFEIFRRSFSFFSPVRETRTAMRTFFRNCHELVMSTVWFS